MSEKPKNFRASDGETNNGITSSELEYILEVNKKTIEINIEVERQYQEILDLLEKVNSRQDEVLTDQVEQKGIVKSIDRVLMEDLKEQIEEIEKGVFRLTIILSSFGLGALLTIIQALIQGHH